MTNPKSYHRPKTIDDTLRLLSQPDSIVLARGGLTLNTLDLPHESIIDIQDIEALKRIRAIDGGFEIGGAVTLSQVAELPGLDPVIRRALIRAIPLNVRNQISIAESLLSPTNEMLREWIAGLSALDIYTDWYRIRGQPISLYAHELFRTEPVKLTREGIMHHLVLHQSSEGRSLLGSSTIARTPSDIAIVNAAVYIRLDAEATPDIAFAAVCGASAAPVMLISLPVDPSLPFAEADLSLLAASVGAQVEPVSDWHGSTDYRREMAVVCVRRALEECLERLISKG
jgi:CO/xanthine dehydrogenase FAD-binding subunit